MSEEIKTNYSGNSHKSKTEVAKKEEVPEKEKFTKITSGEVFQKKKGLGKKIAETFTGDDASSVGNYVLFDVILPNVKTMMSDAVSQGVERMLFGENKRRSTSASRPGGGYTSYNRMHTPSPGGRAFEPDEPRQMSRRARATHNFNEIIVNDRGEAEMILDRLTGSIETYGTTTVSDLYDLVGVTGSFTDDKWGWTDLRDSRVARVRNGYLLDLPPTVQLD